MKALLPLSLLTLVLGIALMAGSVLIGESEIGLVVIFPFVVAHGWMGMLGSMFVFIAVIGIMFGIWSRSLRSFGGSAPEQQTPIVEAQKKYGGVVLIGPIPIAFGSDDKIARKLLLVGLAILAGFLIIFLVLSFVGWPG